MNKENSEKLSKKSVLIITLIYIFMISITMFVSTRVIGLCETTSDSMKNILNTGDYYIENKYAYKLGNLPKRQEIISFMCPETNELYAKRIIGLPGEIVEIKEGYVYINGVKLEEDYLFSNSPSNFGPFKVPEESYFVMGDNRNNSYDSRQWNNKYVPLDKIEGKVWMIYSKHKINVLD